MIKALATDLDGTLFYPKRKMRLLRSKNKKFLKEFHEQGNQIILVTGRNKDVASKVAKSINNDNIIIIGCNGGFVAKGNETVIKNPIDHKDARTLFDLLCKDKKVKSILIFTDKHNIILDDTPLNPLYRLIGYIGMNAQGVYTEKFIRGRKYVYEMLDDETEQIYKIMPWYGIGIHGDDYARDASIAYKQSVGDSFEVLWSWDAVEFVKKGINKAVILKDILRELNIREEDTYVVGDSGNDVPLFHNFENSFVMSHASEEVKKEAKNVVDSVADLKDFIK